jgi:diguanylate cyclase (GGDEF)-like protein
LRIAIANPTGSFGAWLCAAALSCLALPICQGQRFSFRDVADGLGDLNVNCIAQDATGYLWVGTENGLYRYDGLEFRLFGAAEGIHGRTIQNLYAGPDGTLWVGTTAGIYFERANGSFGEVRPPAPVNEFSQRIGTTFTAIREDQVVMADRSGAFLLRHIEPERWAAEPMHLEAGAVWSVQYGADGVLWYGCGKDLCRLANGKTNHVTAPLGMPEDTWLHLLKSRDGHIWLRGYLHVGELVPAANRFELHDLPGPSDAVPYNSLAEDAHGRILASQGPNFGSWAGGGWSMVAARNGLSRFDISNLFVDREGSIWIGVVGHGLRRWLGQGRWEAYTVADGLSDDIVWASLRDRSGRMWIGTESGLDFIPAGGNAPRPWKAQGIETARAVSLAESADGGIWMASAAGSLVRIDPGTLAGSQWKVPECYRVLAARDQVWLATGGGLYVADPAAENRAPRLVEDPAIANPRGRFTDLTLSPDGSLWAAADQGLYRLDSSGWRRIDAGLSGVNPFLIAADRQGNLWASGSFPGIARLRIVGTRVVDSAYITRPRLLSEQVVALSVDDRGWLWVGQDAGLTAFDGETWRGYTQDDGLVWNDIDADALAEDKDGSLWIGTSGGLSHLMDPKARAAGAPPAPVFSLAAFGAADISNGSRIAWNPSPLEVSMASLSFGGGRHIRFRYRLLGFESEWVETAERRIRYPRLEPGAYRFQAEAVDAATGAVSPQAEISFRLTPRWSQGEAVSLGICLLAAIAVVMVIRWQVQRLVVQKRELELAVLRRTEDLEREKTELLYARDQMRHFAEHDGLTGLWNHRIILERLRQEIDRSRRESTPISLILVDLDHFKLINDTYGHPAGDVVLKEVGEIFLSSLRSYDWVGRYGGEEFLLILPGSGFMDARNRAEQLRIAVQSARILHFDLEVPVTASFGLASGFPLSYESMIQAADTALYRAKDNGRNCVIAIEIGPPAGSAEGARG